MWRTITQNGRYVIRPKETFLQAIWKNVKNELFLQKKFRLIMNEVQN